MKYTRLGAAGLITPLLTPGTTTSGPKYAAKVDQNATNEMVTRAPDGLAAPPRPNRVIERFTDPTAGKALRGSATG